MLKVEWLVSLYFFLINLGGDVLNKMKVLFLFTFIVLFGFSGVAYANESDVFIKELDGEISNKILDSLSAEDERFNSYSQLNQDNPNLKYYVYSAQNSTDINVLFYAGLYGGLNWYSNRVEVNMISNNFKAPNLFTFDSSGIFKSKSTATGYVSIYNQNGYYAIGYKPWILFEQYDNGNSSGGDGFVWPKVIMDVFEKLHSIFSDFGQFIKDIFVPSDTNIIQNSLNDLKDKLTDHFKPILDSLDSIKELFTPEKAVLMLNMAKSGESGNDTVSNDFYEIEINIPQLGVDHVQPFKPYSNSRFMIYVICNSLLVITTLVHLIRRIVGSGDVIE